MKANLMRIIIIFSLIRFKVSGYPTIKFFKKSTTPVDYNGGRTQETIVE